MNYYKISFVLIFILIFQNCSKGSTLLVNNKLLSTASPDKRIYKIVKKNKGIAERKLEAHIFYPKNYNKHRKIPYIVAASIHGGGWTQGTVDWGYGDAQYLASLGYVAISFEYRLADNSTSSVECMKDANSAIRWIRIYHKDLNVDPNKVIAIGYSAGGHLVISTAMFPNFIEKSENSNISSVPNLVWAFAPPVKIFDYDYFKKLLMGKADPKKCCPISNVRSGIVPIYIIHGENDQIVPYKNSVKFTTKMKAAGNTIKLWTIKDGEHNAFWKIKKHVKYKNKVVKDQLVKIKWL